MLIPDLEHEQCPEQFAVVFAVLEMFVGQLLDVGAVEKILAVDKGWGEHIRHEFLQVTREPICHWHVEALFCAVDKIPTPSGLVRNK